MLQAILAELEMNRGYFEGQEIETIYFGGGTPSLLSADEINRISDKIFETFPITGLKEFTLEANPDDLGNTYLRALKHTPVSRFSIGVQSFFEEDLEYMHRAHNAQQADYAIKAAQDAGFSNITIDLIYGTPGLTDAKWKQNLEKVAELSIPHFSAYALTVEEGTALHHAIKKKKTRQVDNEQAAGQFEILMQEAERMGYEHYEISNLAKAGAYAVHNTNYWKGQPYLGIGPSAHSFDGRHTRRWNIANNALYIKGLLQDKKPVYEEEQLSPVEHLNEYIMTSMRTMWGCNLDKIRAEWGNEYADQVEKDAGTFEERGWLVKQEQKLVLTPAGKLFADRIAGELFVEELK